MAGRKPSMVMIRSARPTAKAALKIQCLERNSRAPRTLLMGHDPATRRWPAPRLRRTRRPGRGGPASFHDHGAAKRPSPSDLPRCWNTPGRRGSQGYVPVLLRRERLALAAQGAQGADDLRAGFRRADHGVHVTALGRDVGVRERVLVLGDALGPEGILVRRVGQLTAVQNVDRAL